MKVEFLKNGIYRGIPYKKGNIINMSEIDVKAFIDCKMVELYKPPAKNKDINSMSYKDLQKYCKKKGLPAVGSKAELLKALNS